MPGTHSGNGFAGWPCIATLCCGVYNSGVPLFSGLLAGIEWRDAGLGMAQLLPDTSLYSDGGADVEG
ncbi:hypothetical protein [Andreprevotia sp. IGB-42]|uniref:hypothetical protein n=1 Tax=Andreprevotia sp. IGB-42 TaxID=2497473 RepID=UPI0013589A75|nr:hypothetical protein [Andreprevotia sp. IGB-42]